MTRRDALIRVIETLHAEIAALKANDIAGLERATADKLAAIETLRALGDGPAGPELRELASEADRLNETCRIYVNLMAANVRRRLQMLSGEGGNAYRRGPVAAYA
ncbi:MULTISPECIES: flagellar protein FlgN [unclassified Sphingomonas]|uniref:flagellar protein FlgN n=1 Tax=unclassified Sphingomonas TaxID=196159 RepID=UPI0009280434|nr:MULTISPECIES: flagellar protein FlgN [unclassified Sphingomonas]MBN8847839.1 flagellar protein FlgN [Sphingomonas sp.]MBS0285211.1 flagellar protein FlgN [Pseudomonadota bacterium]OJV33485.1 MAG: flagellar protein FlgN [Sphingomonas sp. 67-36]